MATVMRIAENNVAILLVGLYLCTDIIASYPFSNTNPVTFHSSALIYKPRFLIRCINKTEYSFSLTAISKD